MDKNWYLTYAVETRRRDEEMAFAEADHLTELTVVAAPEKLRFYQLWLVKLGDLLVTWGSKLQCRYTRFMAMSAPQNISRADTGPC